MSTSRYYDRLANDVAMMNRQKCECLLCDFLKVNRNMIDGMTCGRDKFIAEGISNLMKSLCEREKKGEDVSKKWRDLSRCSWITQKKCVYGGED